MIQMLPLEIVSLSAGDISRTFELIDKYKNIPMDFADAALVAVAERLDIDTILTTDRRGFSVYIPRHIRSFIVVP